MRASDFLTPQTLKESNMVTAYKVVRVLNGQLVSAANENIVIPSEIGSVITMKGNGIYLSTSKDFVMTYYSGLSDEEALLTYEIDPSDVTGDISAPDGEITASRAKLVKVEHLDPIEESSSPKLSLKWDTNNPRPQDYVVKVVNIESLMGNTNPIQKISLSAVTKSDDENIIGDRVSRAKEHWLSGGEMDMSEVGYGEYSKMVEFTDGRHRLIAAYQLGERYAPVLVDKVTVEAFIGLVDTL